jgi:tetratricopeptide (TPR) repeat protein
VFRSAREAQGLSQDQVAALTDGPALPRTTISSIERGRNLPNVDALLSLSEALHVEPGEILEQVKLARAAPVDLTGLTQEDLRQRAKEQYWAGDYRSALAAYNAMLDLLLLDPPKSERDRAKLHAEIEIDRALALRRCEALKAARGAAERAVELSQGVPGVQVRARIALASILSQSGSPVLAGEAAERAVSLAEGFPILKGEALNQKGSVLHRAGRFKDARQALLQARELLEKAGDSHHLPQVEGNIAECLAGMGKARAARLQYEKALEIARRLQMPALEASWLVALGRLSLAEGRLDEADRRAQAALALAKPREHWLTVFRAEWLRHLVVQQRNPEAHDRHRVAFLRRLYARLKGHTGLSEIQEFRQAVLAPTPGPARRPS